MAERAKARRFKVLTAIGALFVAGVVLLTLPDCDKLRALIVNDSSSELDDVTLSVQNRVVWSGRLEVFGGRRIAVPEGGEGAFVLKGRYAKSGMRFEGASDYVTSHDQLIHLFLVKDNGIYTGSWHDPPWPPEEERGTLDEVRSFSALFLDVTGCVDHALWTLIRGSPEY